MKRRIAAAILLTVWAFLIAGGLLTYAMTRTVLLTDLDVALMNRAASLPGASADRYLVQNEVGQTVARSNDQTLPPPELLHADFSETADGKTLRTVTVRVHTSGGPRTIIYSASAQPLLHLLHRLQWALVIFSLIAGPATALVAWLVSRVALRPLQSTAHQIGQIDEQHLQRRIQVKNLPSELQPVGERLNEMLARLEEAFAQRTQFLAAASHELRTPVASLVTAIEVTLRKPRSGEEYRQTLETCHDECLSLRVLVERLMEQVRGEQSAHDQPPERIDIHALAAHCTGIIAPLAEARGVDVVLTGEQPMPHGTQPLRLKSILLNLLSNAVEYNRAGGQVEVSYERHGQGTLKVVVRDTGAGIDAQHLPRLFEPFYRASAPAAGHLGLGLALVRAHVRALNGQIEVQSVTGTGTQFLILLPDLCPEADSAFSKNMVFLREQMAQIAQN